jgi:hypothetical protein
MPASLQQFFAFLEKKDHLIKKIPNLDDEQKEQIIQHLTKFPHLEKEIDWNNLKNLTFDDFKQILNSESNTQKKKKVKASGISGLREGEDYAIVFDGPNNSSLPEDHRSKYYVGYMPLNYEASKLIASKDIGPHSCEAKWCTAYQKDPGYWYSYVGKHQQTLIYFIHMGEAMEEGAEIFHKVAVLLDSDGEFLSAYNSEDIEMSLKKTIAVFGINIMEFIDWDSFNEAAKEVKREPDPIYLSGNRLKVALYSSEEIANDNIDKTAYVDPSSVSTEVINGITYYNLIKPDPDNIIRLSISTDIQGFEKGVALGSYPGESQISYSRMPKLTEITPEMLPRKIVGTDVTLTFNSMNGLTKIAAIPEGVVKVVFSGLSSLKKLPRLPESIRQVSIVNLSNLESLVGLPKRLKSLYVSSCMRLTSLAGAPEEVEELMLEGLRSVSDFRGGPKKVSTFNLINVMHWNSLKSYQGSPEQVGSAFRVYSSVTPEVGTISPAGLPKKIGFDLPPESMRVTAMDIDIVISGLDLSAGKADPIIIPSDTSLSIQYVVSSGGIRHQMIIGGSFIRQLDPDKHNPTTTTTEDPNALRYSSKVIPNAPDLIRASS